MKRPGITLVEVLVAIFIMGIGMIALLTLFPLGALNIAQALTDDRASQAAANANAISNSFDLRHDPAVLAAFTAQPSNGALPGSPIYVDPWYNTLAGGNTLGSYNGGGVVTNGLTRIAPNFMGANTQTTQYYWFSLLDDLEFETTGVPTQTPPPPAAVTKATTISRIGRFTWAYLLRRPRLDDDSIVDLSVVVYSSRQTTTVSGETTYLMTNTAGIGDNTLKLNYGALATKPRIRNGSWILDTTTDTDKAGNKVVRGFFYRVVDVADDDAGNYTLELDNPLKSTVPVSMLTNTQTNFAIVVMDQVVEVFYRGNGVNP